MTLSKDLLEILACPQCKGEIVPEEKQDARDHRAKDQDSFC